MIEKNRLKENFSKSSLYYDSYAEVQNHMANELFKRIKKQSALGSIMDIGSGTGTLAENIIKSMGIKKIDLVDISEKMIKESAKKLEKYKKVDINFFNEDIEDFEIKKKYDLVYSNASFQWIIDYKKLFQKINKILNKNGILIFSTFADKMYAELKESFYKVDNEHKIVHDFLSLDELKNYILDFEIVEEKEEFIFNYYESLMDFLKVIKKTGAIGAVKEKKYLGKEKISEIEKVYKENYSEKDKIKVTNHIIYMILKKKS